MENTMLIVGAGIAGLSTGYYARLNGFDVTIFESNSVPGGLCAAWSRKGYTFDLSMHMLTGSKSGAFNRMWRELGIVGTREFCYHTALSTIEWKDRTLSLSADAAQLRKELLSLSAEDAPLIEELIKLYGGPSMMNAASLKAPELYNLADLLKMGVAFLPLIKFFRKYGATTIQEFAQRFRHPLLRDAVRFLIDGPGWPMYRYPMAALAGFGEAAVFGAGTPVGGGLVLGWVCAGAVGVFFGCYPARRAARMAPSEALRYE